MALRGSIMCTCAWPSADSAKFKKPMGIENYWARCDFCHNWLVRVKPDQAPPPITYYPLANIFY
jgi:hypothetical protein